LPRPLPPAQLDQHATISDRTEHLTLLIRAINQARHPARNQPTDPRRDLGTPLDNVIGAETADQLHITLGRIGNHPQPISL
ncbi:hypothetical protein, partial [Mycolicibacterium smegmatis]|uniref:hypothetical protein n=1 Tax=Mycolicibacterium smegmatis TaxID=1772 RepID=UPI001880F784